MIPLLKSKNKWKELIILLTFTLFCFSISIFRADYTNSRMFLFLNWNLFLAGIPWALSTLSVLYPSLGKDKRTTFIILTAWLLFFPNAPYILTDLFHLKHNLAMPIWFDLVLVLSFAWTGLLFGILSLLDIEKNLRNFMSARWTSLLIVAILFVSSFGVYIGRYLRWNSWDVLQSPFALFYDLSDRIIHPFAHPRTWGMTILFGLLLNMIFWSLKLLLQKRNV